MSQPTDLETFLNAPNLGNQLLAMGYTIEDAGGNDYFANRIKAPAAAPIAAPVANTPTKAVAERSEVALEPQIALPKAAAKTEPVPTATEVALEPTFFASPVQTNLMAEPALAAPTTDLPVVHTPKKDCDHCGEQKVSEEMLKVVENADYGTEAIDFGSDDAFGSEMSEEEMNAMSEEGISNTNALSETEVSTQTTTPEVPTSLSEQQIEELRHKLLGTSPK